MHSSSMPPPPPEPIVAGKYELVEMIGRGGMGSVWRARHLSLGTYFAVKFIEAEHAKSKEARQRFHNEAKAAATLKSKYAIQIFDHGVTESGKPYIVMELLTGETLDKRIQRLGRLSLVETARILHQVCRALGRAHEAGIIHRDLKPENIFLVHSPDDDEEIAKVLDFGIAKIRTPEAPESATSSTKTGAVLGTPYYMSPEQARGLRTVDHRTDLWSLGVIAFRSVTGKLPFDGESLADLLVKICVSPLPQPSALCPDLPRAFDAWFERALSRDLSLRFSSAAELSDALSMTAGISTRAPSRVGPYLEGSSSSVELPVAHAGTAAPFVTSNLPPGARPKGFVALMLALPIVLAVAGAGFFLFSRSNPRSHAQAGASEKTAAPPPDRTPAPPASVERVDLRLPEPNTSSQRESREAGAPPPRAHPSAPNTPSAGTPSATGPMTSSGSPPKPTVAPPTRVTPTPKPARDENSGF